MYVVDLGDDWGHLCTLGPVRIDPVDTLGSLPDRPLPYRGVGRHPRPVPAPMGRRRRRVAATEGSQARRPATAAARLGPGKPTGATMSTTPSPRRPPIFGPEPWEEIGSRSWSHWDRWFCAVAVADHESSLDQLEQRLLSELRDRIGGREGTESKLSHLADLRTRLDDTGLAPGDLVTPEALAERGLLAKARKKLAERYLEGRAMTPAMIETPRVRLERRSRTGRWDAFPVNPDRYYRSFRRNVEVKDHVSENRSFGAVRRIEETTRVPRQGGTGRRGAPRPVPRVPYRRPGARRPSRRLLRKRRRDAARGMARVPRHRLAGGRDGARGLLGRPV